MHVCALATAIRFETLNELGLMSVLSLYILLGIGVDDLYVMTDAFRQSQHEIIARNTADPGAAASPPERISLGRRCDLQHRNYYGGGSLVSSRIFSARLDSLLCVLAKSSVPISSQAPTN